MLCGYLFSILHLFLQFRQLSGPGKIPEVYQGLFSVFCLILCFVLLGIIIYILKSSALV